MTTSPDHCTCPGQTIMYTFECTAAGGLLTLWNGNAIDPDCTQSDLILYHDSHFMNSSSACDDGRVVLQGVRVVNDCFTSRLTVTRTCPSWSSALNKTVQCIILSDGTHNTDLIGTTELYLTTGN